MSSPDYEAFSEDHQCLLIVIKQIGPQMSSQLFDLIYDRLTQLGEFKVTDHKANDCERIIRLRYRRSYSIENNDWADFQAHRRLVGLITVARSFNDNEIESICELHNTIRDTYTNTLFDSRCFIIKSGSGSRTTPTTNNDKVVEEKNGEGEEELKENTINMIDSDRQQHQDLNLDAGENGENDLFDFHLEGQLYDNSLKTHLNQSSSSSSSSLDKVTSSTAKLKVNNEQQQQQPQSLLPLTLDPSSLSDGVVDSGFHSVDHFLAAPSTPQPEPRISRLRTHSRNKSFDSRILNQTLPTNPSDGLMSMGANSKLTSRTHSSSSLVSGNEEGDNYQQTFLASSTNEYIRYESDEQCCQQIELRVRQFITGLFWVLEKKRFDRTRENRMDKVQLLMAPFEKKDFIGLNTDSRLFRRRCIGRMRKHIADLSLLAGLPIEALNNYLSAIEELKAVKDKLWLASAYEGYCATSLALLYPTRCHHVQKLRRQFRYDQSLLTNILARSDYAQARTEVAEAMEKHKSSRLQMDAKMVNKKDILGVDQFYERYKEAASNYAQYRGAAIIEFECSFKAARTLIFLEQRLKASDFIQNAVFVIFNQTPEEQIERLLRISHLYENVRFYRKAAFYKRFAALKTVSSQLKTQDWSKCYYLLLSALDGYNMSLDPVEHERRMVVNIARWPSVHMQILQEMFTTAGKMANDTLAMRHLCFILQCLFNHITPEQRRDFALRLSTLAAKCGEGSPVVLKLPNALTIPSVNFTKFPTVIFFMVEPLAAHLRPYKLKWKEELEGGRKVHDHGPFIFTPLQLNRSPTTVTNENEQIKLKFFWSEGDIGRVKIRLHNYLPIDLFISSITPMTDGVAFEPKHDTSLKIPPESTYEDIFLTGVPRATGNLDILGYKIHALGVKSDCRLAQLPTARRLKLPAKYTVEVVPRLPLMCAMCLGAELKVDNVSQELSDKEMSADFHISTTSFLSIYTGQVKKFTFKLTNISKESNDLIELVNVQVLYSKSVKRSSPQLVEVKWDPEKINQACPFAPGQAIEFEVSLKANGDFVYNKLQEESKRKLQSTLVDRKLFSKSDNDVAGVVGSKKPQVFGSSKLASLISEFQNSRKGQESLAALPEDEATEDEITEDEEHFPKEIFESKQIYIDIQLEYSGGAGLISGFCRRTAIRLKLEVKPSILITHWDVISAKQQDECYLVFDALNATNEEANLHYSANKEMLIEPHEKCRIPVPIKRCPLVAVNAAKVMAKQLQEENIGHRSSEIMGTLKDDGNDFMSSIFPEGLRLDAILDECREHLLTQVQLQWNLMDEEGSNGRTAIEEIPYSADMLKLLLIPPVQSKLTINDSVTSDENCLCEINVPLGVHTPLNIQMVNTSDVRLRPLRLLVITFQDYQNGSLPQPRNYNMESRLIMTGQEAICIDVLDPNETYTHHFGLKLLYPGVYRMQVYLMSEKLYQKKYQTLGLNSSVRIYEKFMSDVTSFDGEQMSNVQSFYQCLHSIEFTVV